MKTEYDQLVLIILNHKGLSEHNFIISFNDLKKTIPDLAQLLETHKCDRGFYTYYFASNKTISVKKCKNMKEFNLFVAGMYNEGCEGDFYWVNEFYSDGFRRLLCKDPFQNVERCYDLY